MKKSTFKEILLWLSILVMLAVLIVVYFYAGWIMLVCMGVGAAIKWVIDEPLTNSVKKRQRK